MPVNQLSGVQIRQACRVRVSGSINNLHTDSSASTTFSQDRLNIDNVSFDSGANFDTSKFEFVVPAEGLYHTTLKIEASSNVRQRPKIIPGTTGFSFDAGIEAGRPSTTQTGQQISDVAKQAAGDTIAFQSGLEDSTSNENMSAIATVAFLGELQ
jgi:hypothetical protein